MSREHPNATTDRISFEHFASFSTIVVGTPNWLGDVVMTEPFLRNLRNVTSAQIVLLCRQSVFDLSVCFKNHIEGLSVFSYDCDLKNCFEDIFDLDPKTTLWLSLNLEKDFCCVAKRCAARTKFGYKHEKTSDYVTHKLNSFFFNYSKHNSQNYMDIFNAFSLNISDPSVPKLLLSERDSAEFVSYLRSIFSQNEKYLVFNTASSNGPAKVYPIDKFVSLASMVLETLPEVSIVFTGLEHNSQLDQIGDHSQRVVNLTGHTNLQQLLYLLYGSELLVTSDTGPMHISAAFDRPTIAIFGPTSPLWTGPLGNNSYIMKKSPECAPCMEHHCPLERQICFDGIEPRDVLAQIKTVLGAKHFLKAMG